jgi:hypothetical protein
MARAAPAQVAFNSGELSRSLDARTDYTKYPSGCSVMRNFIPTVQGPAKRRGGTRFIAAVKDNSKRVYLQRFEYSVDQAYILEFGDTYIRFYTWDTSTLVRGRLESPPGTPVEVVTPYTQADLYNIDGTCKLRFAQSGDFLYIAHPSYQTRILKRTSATTFTLTTFETVGGPFKDVDPDQTITVWASAQTGAGITLTASSAIFLAGHVGSLFYLEQKNVQSITAWEPGKVIALGQRRRSDAKTYEALNAATTGASRPVHNFGAQFDGDTGVQWQFRDPGYGYVRITAIGGGGTTATADVIDRLPADVVGAPNATTRWAHGAWSAVEGWPTDIAFFRERLWLARNQTLWASVSAGFDDFSRLNFGQVTDDMAITLTIASGTLNKIQWLIADKELIAGTAGNEFIIGEYSNGSPIAPGNVRVRTQSQYGSRGIVPCQAGQSVLFVQRAGLKLREIAYDEVSGYQSMDVTVDADHITQSGIPDLDYAQEPDPLVWAARADGKLVSMTWSTEQRVRGWHRHPIGGPVGTAVESVATMPAAEGDRNEVWMVVKRTINGVTKRYVEYMDRPWQEGDEQKTQLYMDSALTYSGAATTTISGLTHLEGQVVDILTNGAPHPQRTVSGGLITLQAAYTYVNVGLPAPCQLKTMRMEAGSADGTAQGKTKRMHKMTFRFLNTGGGKGGPDDDHMEWIMFGQGAPMDQPVPLFTGDRLMDWPKGYETDAYVQYINDQPMAVTLEGIYPVLVTQDAR